MLLHLKVLGAGLLMIGAGYWLLATSTQWLADAWNALEWLRHFDELDAATAAQFAAARKEEQTYKRWCAELAERAPKK